MNTQQGSRYCLLSLNRNQLKYLVIAAMLLDHIAWAFVPLDSILGQTMHFIGRLTGPTMAYFVVEGYCHTRNVKKYAQRLGIFALLSWIPFVYFEYGCMPIAILKGNVTDSAGKLLFYMQRSDRTLAIVPQFGVVYTLLLGLLAIWLWDRGNCPRWYKKLGIIGLCMLSFFGDWPVYDVLYCFFLFYYREDPESKWTAFGITTLFCCAGTIFEKSIRTGFFTLGIFMVPVLLHFCYNGERGSGKPVHKWFFYWFYPVHLLILGMLRWIILV